MPVDSSLCPFGSPYNRPTPDFQPSPGDDGGLQRALALSAAEAAGAPESKSDGYDGVGIEECKTAESVDLAGRAGPSLADRRPVSTEVGAIDFAPGEASPRSPPWTITPSSRRNRRKRGLFQGSLCQSNSQGSLQ